MKKIKFFGLCIIFFEIMTFSSMGSSGICDENDTLQCESDIFGRKEKSFWEKNLFNMKQTIPWREFETIKKILIKEGICAETEFVIHDFQKHDGTRGRFMKIPGFADGSCLWSHLGVVPRTMMDVLEDCLKELQNNLMNDQLEDSNLLPELMEAVQLIDPLAISNGGKEPGKNIKEEFNQLVRKANQVLPHWYRLIKKYGGTVFKIQDEFAEFLKLENLDSQGNRDDKNEDDQNQKEDMIDALRPPNGDTFFQVMSEYLKTNIAIFSKKKSSRNRENSRFFNRGGTKHWLYLLQKDNGTHYDILVEVDKPVSRAITAEMNSFLASKLNQIPEE
ncbi:hypothetical protein [Holospora undulata]|nr:hypothetical protein [Holospora undulata]